MSYELSPFPPALLEARNVFWKADKPQLVSAICDHARDAILDFVPETGCYVLDWGSLIHRMPWKPGDSYGRIAQLYADFTVRHYGSSAVVVFDGYEEWPSKDITHQRRRHTIHPLVSFTAETQFYNKKEEFMSTDSNKQRLIWMVSDELKKRLHCSQRTRGCWCTHSEGCSGEVSTCIQHTTTLIGEVTDLLVLLLYYA